MLKLDRGIMNTFQLQSVNIYAKQANYRGGALCAPPHQYTGEKSPSGIGLKICKKMAHWKTGSNKKSWNEQPSAKPHAALQLTLTAPGFCSLVTRRGGGVHYNPLRIFARVTPKTLNFCLHVFLEILS